MICRIEISTRASGRSVSGSSNTSETDPCTEDQPCNPDPCGALAAVRGRMRFYATKALSYDCDFMILKWSLRGLLRCLTRRRWPSTRAARRTTLTDSVARRAGANEAKTSLLVQGKLHLGPYRFFFSIPPACVRILRLSRAPLSACFAANGRPCTLEDEQPPVKKASSREGQFWREVFSILWYTS